MSIREFSKEQIENLLIELYEEAIDIAKRKADWGSVQIVELYDNGDFMIYFGGDRDDFYDYEEILVTVEDIFKSREEIQEEVKRIRKAKEEKKKRLMEQKEKEEKEKRRKKYLELKKEFENE